MNTHLTQDQLDAYVDGTLSLDELRSLDAHLEACAECRDAVEAERRIHQHVAQSLSAHLNSQHPSSRMRFTHIGRKMREAPQQRWSLSPSARTALQVAAAALLFVAGGATVALLNPSTQPTQDQARTTTQGGKLSPPRAPTKPSQEPLDPSTIQPLPKGWDVTVTEEQHIVGMLPHGGRNGGSGSVITSTSPTVATFGAMTQKVSATTYRGKRLRLRGYLSTHDVSNGWAGLWMRIDSKEGGVLAFDNMQKRPVTGTTPWLPYEVVLDVPADAHRVVFGALMVGAGTVYFDDATLNTVDTSVPTTNATSQDALDAPMNLDFEGTPTQTTHLPKGF